MNRYINRVVVLFFVLMVALPGAAAGLRKHPEFHYLTLSLGAGGSETLTDYDNMKSKFGFGGLFGFGYEYHFRAFWLSLGVEGQLFQSGFLPAMNDTMHYSMYDTEGEKMTYHYAINKRGDMHRAVYLNVPVMIGFNVKGFYLGAGAKAGLSLYGRAKSDVDYTTSATYDRFIDDFINMPNHYYTNYSNSGVHKMKFEPMVSVIGEVGYEVVSFSTGKEDDSNPIIFRIGAYAEYGLFNMVKSSGSGPLFEIDQTDPSQVTLYPYFTTVSTEGHKSIPLSVGVKATFMFQLPLPQKCHCLQTERGASWRKDASKSTRRANKQSKKSAKKSAKKVSE